MQPQPMTQDYARNGWAIFDTDPAVVKWVQHALPAARAAVRDPELAHWLQCHGTWFVGVDALANDAQGRLNGSDPVAGAAVELITVRYGPLPPLHRAQLSVIYPGYPRPREGENDAAFRYRQRRDAAHVDGVRATDPGRRRKVAEPHAFVLGLPLTPATHDAAPLVVWQGSHHILRAAFTDAFQGREPADWHDVDVTEPYMAARRRVFETCARIPLPVQPGQAVVLHRLALHGVAPWADGASADPDGRMVAYFRPDMPGGVPAWLAMP